MKLLSKNTVLIVLAVLAVVQFGLLGLAAHHQNNTNHQYAQEINTLEENIADVGNGTAYQPVTVSPTDNKIYLPQLSLALPLTALGASLEYSPDTAYVTGSYKVPTGPLNEATISTFSTAGASQSQSQFDCSGLVRIKFEAKPDPYNPSEKWSGSVALGNGKTLQIYASHQKACQKEWTMTQANADAIAALFKQATSY